MEDTTPLALRTFQPFPRVRCATLGFEIQFPQAYKWEKRPVRSRTKVWEQVNVTE